MSGHKERDRLESWRHVDVEVATGEENAGMAVAGRLDAAAATTGRAIDRAMMDAGYTKLQSYQASLM